MPNREAKNDSENAIFLEVSTRQQARPALRNFNGLLSESKESAASLLLRANAPDEEEKRRT